VIATLGSGAARYFCGFFYIVKSAQSFVVLPRPVVRLPFLSPPIPRNTCMPARVRAVPFLVSCVASAIYESKVYPTIVRTIPVNVVDLTLWHLAGHNRPSGAVRAKFVVEQPAVFIPGVNARAGFFPRILGIPHMRQMSLCAAPARREHLWRAGFPR
jgi:hypothetical protein